MEDNNREAFQRLHRLERLCPLLMQQLREAPVEVVRYMEALAHTAAAAAAAAAVGPVPDAMRTAADRGSARPTVTGGDAAAVLDVGRHLQLTSDGPLNVVSAAARV